MNGESFGRRFWRAYRQNWQRTWKRDLLAWPVAFLLTLLALTALYGRTWYSAGWSVALPALVIGCLTWPVAYWLLDRIFGRYRTPS